MNTYPKIEFPHEFPWGVALFDSATGKVLQANACMTEVYGCKAGGSLNDVFSYHQDRTTADVVDEMSPAGSWAGRVFPKDSRYGIASTEVMLQRDAKQPECIWLYTLEHPKVDNQIRFSSRSELKMLRVILDNTLDYVFFRDMEGHFILTNRAFQNAVAEEKKFPDIENTIQDFVSEETGAWFGQLDANVLESGQPEINQVSEVSFRNGVKQWLQLTTVPVRNGEKETIGFLSVARDISDLKRTEADLLTAIDRANQANNARGEFLAAMSHEIRTPINGVIGASELCQETRLDAEQRGYIDTVIQCSNTLLTLVNDILDFSKIEAGQLNLEKLNFTPLKVMESVAAELSPMARSKDLELIVACEETVPDFLMGDPTRLKQVLYNLLGNAVKFTDHGEVIIRASVLKKDEKEARIRFTVEDTGIGIEEARREAIFDSFTQADMSTSRKYGGTGLGLAICKELVTLMGGEIMVSSEIGIGTCFTFDLPFELTEMVGAKAVPFNAELSGMRVLIVDDNSTNREIYAQMCGGWGYRSEVVSDGIGALNMLEEAVKQNDPFSLLILDQQMPGLTGLDLAALVRSRSSIKDTKAILLSSSLDHAESKRAEEIGISRSLAKPVKRETLLEIILETFEVGKSAKKAEDPSASVDLMDRDVCLSILLVEDNPVNQTVAKRRLEKLGHEVTVASDGSAALKYVKSQHFDGILMDIEMPGMDGYETTAKIREFEEETDRPCHWIVAMTAHAMKGDREHCLAEGMNDYIAKPFRLNNLTNTLANMMVNYHNAPKVERPEEDSSERKSASKFLDALDPTEREDLLVAVPAFIEAMPEEIIHLREALDRSDFASCAFTAHSLKGVIGLFGDNRAMKLASELEQLVKKNQPDMLTITDYVDRLSVVVATLTEELEIYITEKPVESKAS